MITKHLRLLPFLLLAFLLTACAGLPDEVLPVKNFDVNRYLGKWYEIARLDHPFERGLEQVTAEYSLREDGGLRVVNRGYSSKDKTWQQAEGKAYFVNSTNEGHLKVSFFGPFYGTYAIFNLDQENYSYAFVSGPDKSFLWLLSRTPTVDQQIIDKFISEASALGFSNEKLIFVEHSPASQ